MSNLMLTRTAGQSVRLQMGDKTEYVEVLEVTGGYCKFRLLSTLRTERVKFRGTLAVAEGVGVTVIDLARRLQRRPRKASVQRAKRRSHSAN